MKPLIKLGYNLVDCPKSWQNFILHLQLNPCEAVSMQVIQQELSKFDAKYCVIPDHHVEFDSEKQFTWFVLQWS